MLITVTWDDQVGAPKGWYWEVISADGEVITDSAKLDAPIDADRYGIDEEKSLRRALKKAYPSARIVAR